MKTNAHTHAIHSNRRWKKLSVQFKSTAQCQKSNKFSLESSQKVHITLINVISCVSGGMFFQTSQIWAHFLLPFMPYPLHCIWFQKPFHIRFLCSALLFHFVDVSWVDSLFPYPLQCVFAFSLVCLCRRRRRTYSIIHSLSANMLSHALYRDISLSIGCSVFFLVGFWNGNLFPIHRKVLINYASLYVDSCFCFDCLFHLFPFHMIQFGRPFSVSPAQWHNTYIHIHSEHLKMFREAVCWRCTQTSTTHAHILHSKWYTNIGS